MNPGDVPRHPPQALAVGAEHQLIDECEAEAQGRQRGRRTDRDNLAAGAGLLEVVWAIALKHTNGFTRLWPSVIGVSAAVTSFIMRSGALKSLPVGTAYAVWVGIGALGRRARRIVALGESAAPLRVGFLALILIGVVGLKFVEG